MRHPREFKLYDRHSYFLPSLFFCFVLRLDNSLASEFDIGIGTFKLPGDRWLSLSHLGTTVLAGHIFCYPRGTSSWNIATSSITRLGRPGGFTSFLSFHVVAVIHFSWRSSSSIVRISQTSFSYRTMSQDISQELNSTMSPIPPITYQSSSSISRNSMSKRGAFRAARSQRPGSASSSILSHLGSEDPRPPRRHPPPKNRKKNKTAGLKAGCPG